MGVTSYLLGKKAGGGTPINNQNKDITITENGTATVSADAGYTGLGTVGITTNVQPDLESKSVTITENTTTTITPTTGKDGLSSVEVTTNVPTSGPDLSEYFDNTIGAGTQYTGGYAEIIKKIPSPLIASSNLDYAFNGYNATTIPTITGIEDVTSIAGIFSGCKNVLNFDLSYWNTEKITMMFASFRGCQSINSLNLSNFNTSRVTNTRQLFADCINLETLNISNFNFESVSVCNDMFLNCHKLTNLVFGYDLGKGYLTTASANYNNYTLDLHHSYRLTHDSLMSVINGLYDIATAGVQPQKLVLGSANLAKLSQAEKDIVTNKGWTLS